MTDSERQIEVERTWVVVVEVSAAVSGSQLAALRRFEPLRDMSLAAVREHLAKRDVVELGPYALPSAAKDVETMLRAAGLSAEMVSRV